MEPSIPFFLFQRRTCRAGHIRMTLALRSLVGCGGLPKAVATQLLPFWTSSTGMWLSLVKTRRSCRRGHQS